MELPSNIKTIGIVVYDEDIGAATILFDDHWIKTEEPIAVADAMKDVAYIAEKKYNESVDNLHAKATKINRLPEPTCEHEVKLIS